MIKHLKVKCTGSSSTERLLYHFHYTHWPDHGAPEHPLPVLNFIKESSAMNPPNAGPIVVHCSAGVGRTGAYIVIDSMLKQIQAEGALDIKSFLQHIRNQRSFLVQTEEQYIFIHEALVEAIQSGETDVPADSLSAYIKGLIYRGAEGESSQLDQQYMVSILSFQ